MADRKSLPNMLRLMTIGTEFGITVCLLVFGGVWLDGKLGTTPVFTLLGGTIGFGAGLYNLVRQARKLQGQDKDRK
jgi:ATP synthase protein I